jgi:hypothetical protein
MPSARTMARAHGAFNLVSGVWPLLHMRSFEAVSGPKVDRWLVRTVAGLLVTNGVAQMCAADAADGDVDLARRLGVGTALTLALIDLRYGIPGRIRRIYLADALVEAAWVAGWVRAT